MGQNENYRWRPLSLVRRAGRVQKYTRMLGTEEDRMAALAEDGANGRVDRRAIWRDWSPAIALGVGFVGVIVSILAVGVAILGAVDRLRVEIDGVRGDIRSVRTELKAEIDSVRGEIDGVRAEIRSVRDEIDGVRAEIRSVRTELKADIDNVRIELKAEIRGVRTRFETEIDGVKTQTRELEAGHAETRERLARVETQLDSPAGERPPAGSENPGE